MEILSDRECKIIYRLRRLGYKYDEIAEIFFCSTRTVKRSLIRRNYLEGSERETIQSAYERVCRRLDENNR